MKVILRENVPNVGKIGDILTVADGFGRNYLLPRNLAMLANERAVGEMAHKKAMVASRLAKAKAEAMTVAQKLNGVTLTVKRHAGEDGKLFGTVTSREIAELLAEQGFQVDRRDLVVPENIKALGEFAITAKLHGDVSAKITLTIESAD